MEEPPGPDNPPPQQPPPSTIFITIPPHKTTTKDGRIPPDSLLQIWSHLPLPSLYRFRTVSHLWNRLISSDPLLPTLRHTNHHPPSKPPPLLLILRHTPTDPIKHPDRPTHLSTTPFHRILAAYPTTPHTHPPKNFFTPYTDTALHLLPSPLVGPLVCFSSHRFFYLSNPSTNQSLRLSPPPSTVTTTATTSTAAFGYFPLKQCYILVHISNADSSAHVLVFGPGQAESASWKPVQSPVPAQVRGFGVMVSGLFFWKIASDGDGSGSGLVLALDTDRGSFDVIWKPIGNPGEEMLYDNMYLVAFRGSVCAVDNFSRPPRMEVWVLHDDGEKEKERFHWVRKYNVLISGMGRDMVYPFCEYDDDHNNGDKIVLCNGTRSRLYIYEIKSRSIKQVYKPLQRSSEQLALYTPGLFPLRMLH